MIDSRASGGGTTIRRRRECLGCEHRYTTYEEIERPHLMVLKRDGRSEELSREKLISSIQKACQKRPVTQEAITELVENILEDLGRNFDREVPYGAIGTRVLLQPWVVLAADPRKLLAAIDDRFFGGAMPPGVRAEIYATMQAIDDAEERARTALFLAVTSFQYQVSR